MICSVAGWAERLRADGLLGRLAFDTYFPEQGRYVAMPAAEEVFAADSRLVLAQLTHHPADPERALVVTGLSLFNVATGFLGTREAAADWLRAQALHAVADRTAVDEVTRLARGGTQASLPGWAAIASAHQARADALGRYRNALPGGVDKEAVLHSLLHMHHNRNDLRRAPGRSAALARPSRSVAFTHQDGRLISDSVELCGFVYLVGEEEGERRAPLTEDATVSLHWDRDQAVHPDMLRGVLDQPRTSAWSGVTVAGDEPYDVIWLRITVTDPRTCRLNAHPEVSPEMCDPIQPLRSPALVDGDSLAYLTSRRQDTDGKPRWELGDRTRPQSRRADRAPLRGDPSLVSRTRPTARAHRPSGGHPGQRACRTPHRQNPQQAHPDLHGVRWPDASHDQTGGPTPRPRKPSMSGCVSFGRCGQISVCMGQYRR